MKDIKIEKGVPIPHRAESNGLTATLKRLEIGDSFLYPQRLRNSIATTAKACGVKAVTRNVSNDEVRVWRIA